LASNAADPGASIAARDNNAGYTGKASGVVHAPGGKDGRGMNDHRGRELPNHSCGGFQRGTAQIGIANGIDDQIVGRQRAAGERRREDSGGKHRIVEKQVEPHIAASGSHQQQHLDRLAAATLG
jgi:hypothetical protein